MNHIALLAHHHPFLVSCVGGISLTLAGCLFFLWLDWMEAIV